MRKGTIRIIAEALADAAPLDMQFGTPQVRQHRECCERVADAISDVTPGFDRVDFLARCANQLLEHP